LGNWKGRKVGTPPLRPVRGGKDRRKWGNEKFLPLGDREGGDVYLAGKCLGEGLAQDQH